MGLGHTDYQPALTKLLSLFDDELGDQMCSVTWILLDIADHGIILRDRDGILADELEIIRNRLQNLGAAKVVLPDGIWYWDLKPDWKPGEVVDL